MRALSHGLIRSDLCFKRVPLGSVLRSVHKEGRMEEERPFKRFPQSPGSKVKGSNKKVVG